MCRLAGLLADPGSPHPPLSTLLLDPPHSLEQQSHSPRERRYSQVNVDGTGVAWWADDAPEPLRYVTDKPLWSDPNLPWLAPRLRSGGQLAAVRAATTGIPQGSNFVAPFLHGRLAAVHNGWIGRFRTHLARPLLQRLPDELFAAFHGASDSLVLFLTVVAHLQRDPAGGLAAAVGAAATEIVATCRDRGAPATLNLVVGDGEHLVALRAATGEAPYLLHLLDHGRRWPEAVVVASEPLDGDPAWEAIDPGTLLTISPKGVTRTDLPDLAG